jgi:hypothetical protein
MLQIDAPSGLKELHDQMMGRADAGRGVIDFALMISCISDEGLDGIRAFLPVHVALPLPQDKVRIIAVTSGRRLAGTPGLPTLIEQGFPGLEAYIRFGLLAPAGTPSDLVERYSKTIDEIVRSPELADRLTSQGLTVVGGTSQSYSEAIAADLS